MKSAVEAIVSPEYDWQNDKSSTSIRHRTEKEGRGETDQSDSATENLCENFNFPLYWWTC